MTNQPDGGPSPYQPPIYQPPPPIGHYPGPRLAGLPPDHPEMVAYRRRKRRRMFVVGGAMVLLFGLIGVGVYFNHDPSDASVGDCISGTTGANARTRSCNDPKATYKVVETHDNVTEDRAGFVCDSPATTMYFYHNGTVLCLAPHHP